MNQDPLSAIRRRVARPRSEFPDTLYNAFVLEPQSAWSRENLATLAREVWLAHAIVLASRRSIEADAAREAVATLLADDRTEAETPYHHALAETEATALAAAGGALRLGTAPDEISAAVGRLFVRNSLLDVYDHVVNLRDEVAGLAGQHLNTLVVITSNGQSVQPTSLGHYLASLLGPLGRLTRRLRQVWERVNLSPIGAVAGAASAVPVRRERSAELLGFGGVVENTLDAIAATDWLDEISSIIASLGITLSGLSADMRHWGRDDVGTLTPGEGFVHRGIGQPQRFDPRILDHLHARTLALMSLPATLVPLLSSRQMLGSEPSRIEATRLVAAGLANAIETLRLYASLIASLDVNRSMFATRTNRGFSTSSELADLLAIDFKLPAVEAYAIAERVVAEALQAGFDATTLRTDLIDRVALQMIGREIGIEPEMLSRCLAPKRFIERRDVFGGPAPAAVSASLEREGFAVRQDRAWARETRDRIVSARETLFSEARALAGES